MSLAGLILAAGASRRMGTPKALLEINGLTFLDHLIGIFSAHCSTVVAVLGHSGADIRASLRRPEGAVFVTNPRPERGQLSSLQCGLRAIPPEAEGVLFTPVDYPGIQPETVSSLAKTFDRERAHAMLVIPRHQGRRGHPVCAARELIAEFLNLPEDGQARDVVHRHLDRSVYVDVDDAGILTDVDDPAAYQQLLGRLGAS